MGSGKINVYVGDVGYHSRCTGFGEVEVDLAVATELGGYLAIVLDVNPRKLVI